MQSYPSLGQWDEPAFGGPKAAAGYSKSRHVVGVLGWVLVPDSGTYILAHTTVSLSTARANADPDSDWEGSELAGLCPKGQLLWGACRLPGTGLAPESNVPTFLAEQSGRGDLQALGYTGSAEPASEEAMTLPWEP